MKWLRRRRKKSLSGQGTLEYAVLVAAFVAVFIAFAALWRSLESGAFVSHALASASHWIGFASVITWADIVRY